MSLEISQKWLCATLLHSRIPASCVLYAAVKPTRETSSSAMAETTRARRF